MWLGEPKAARELLGVRMSLGTVSRPEHRMSEALAGPVAAALAHARAAAVKHADGTTWKARACFMLSLGYKLSPPYTLQLAGTASASPYGESDRPG